MKSVSPSGVARVGSFFFGASLAINETLTAHSDQPWVYAAAVALMGLPMARTLESVTDELRKAELLRPPSPDKNHTPDQEETTEPPWGARSHILRNWIEAAQRALDYVAPRPPHGWVATSPAIERAAGLVFDIIPGQRAIMWPGYWEWQYRRDGLIACWRVRPLGYPHEGCWVDPAVGYIEAMEIFDQYPAKRQAELEKEDKIKAEISFNKRAKERRLQQTQLTLHETLGRLSRYGAAYREGNYFPPLPRNEYPRPTAEDCHYHEFQTTPDGYHYCIRCGELMENLVAETKPKPRKNWPPGPRAQ